MASPVPPLAALRPAGKEQIAVQHADAAPRNDPVEISSPVFHSTLVCDDFDRARETLTRLFGTRAQDGGSWSGRRAAFVPVGDAWVEAMVPTSFEPGRGSLANFLARFGNHWHSLAWTVAGVQPLAERLRSAGVRYFDSAGQLIEGKVPAHGPFPVGEMEPFPEDWESRVLFTSLRDSHGGLEFVEPSSPHPFLPRLSPVAHPAADGPGITASTHYTFAVADRAAARDFWLRAIGASVVAECANPAAGTHSIFVRFGTGRGNVVELAEPVEPGAARRDREACGIDMLHASHFNVVDLARAGDWFEGRGFRIEWSSAHQFVLDPALTLGARFGFTDVAEPPYL